MSRIGGISSLNSQQISSLLNLSQIGQDILQKTRQLSTNLRINSAADDPAGLVSLLHLQSRLSALDATSTNLGQASALVGTAATAAGNIVTQLRAAQAIASDVAGGTLSAGAVAGQQAALDAIIRGIDSQAGTQYNGQGLLDGASSFRISGADSTKLKNVTVLNKQNSDDVTVNVNVTTAATRATNSYNGGTLSGAATVQITGPDGSTSVSLANGATTSDIASAFNSVSYLTGVAATRVDANQVNFNSVDYGSAAEFTIQASSGSFTPTASGAVSGTDAVATINGQSITGNGSTFSAFTGGAALSIAVDPSTTGAIAPFTVSGSGLQFLIGDSAAATARIGLPNLTSGNLNGLHGTLASVLSGGANSLTSGNAANALHIIDDAISHASIGQSIIASFQKYTLDSASGLNSAETENLNSAVQTIAGINAPLLKQQVSTDQLLLQTTLDSLQIFDHYRQDVLSLLGDATSSFH